MYCIILLANIFECIVIQSIIIHCNTIFNTIACIQIHCNTKIFSKKKF